MEDSAEDCCLDTEDSSSGFIHEKWPQMLLSLYCYQRVVAPRWRRNHQLAERQPRVMTYDVLNSAIRRCCRCCRSEGCYAVRVRRCCCSLRRRIQIRFIPDESNKIESKKSSPRLIRILDFVGRLARRLPDLFIFAWKGKGDCRLM